MQENSSDRGNLIKEIAILTFLFLLSLVSVFGIYNPYGHNLISWISHIDNDAEKIANYAILGLSTITMVILGGVNFKKQALKKKIQILFLVFIIVAIIIGLVLFYTQHILYPVVSIVTVGIFIYMSSLMVSTIGVRGLFFFLAIFGMFLVAVWKYQTQDVKTIIFLAELSFAIIIFLSVTYPRIKALFFKIGTRDNVDISNAGGSDSEYEDNDE